MADALDITNKKELNPLLTNQRKARDEWNSLR
jgi:hypothetical protein